MITGSSEGVIRAINRKRKNQVSVLLKLPDAVEKLVLIDPSRLATIATNEAKLWIVFVDERPSTSSNFDSSGSDTSDKEEPASISIPRKRDQSNIFFKDLN